MVRSRVTPCRGGEEARGEKIENEGQKSGVPVRTIRGGAPFGVGVGVPVWCWCRRAAWVTGLAGPAVATHARVRIGASWLSVHQVRTHTPAAPRVQRQRIRTNERIIQPRYWSKYSNAFTYES